ncbi:NAD(P)H-binding protein [Dactylosporangium sp. CS-033363]|uniref:NAD(P)H-binding protein n=1 Tax=Dactylosporangium sp. CS-033363 TaxID=3239935 RepID=UPI003D8DAE85
MIILTGANGAFGRLVTTHLLALTPDVAVSVRDPARAADLGVPARHGDFARAGTLPSAFAGASTVLINGTYLGAAPEVRGPQLRGAIAAAVEAGAARVVVTSWPDLARNTLPSTADYAGTESFVRGLAVRWTLVRVGFGLAAALARDVLAARRDGVLTAPAGDARLAVASTADLAEATARVLAGGPEHDGRTYELTGPDTVGWSELAALAGVAYAPEPEPDFRERWVARGWPAPVVEQLLALYACIRSGWAGSPTGELEALLGRRPVAALAAVREAVRE